MLERVFNHLASTMPHPPNHARQLPRPVDIEAAGPRGDTAAWRLQVWISFGLAAMLAASGLMILPGTDIDRAFMVMGYVFSVSSAFAVAKFVRDQGSGSIDSPLWKLVVWVGFAFAMGLTGWGLTRMAINPVWKAYLVVSWLFLISSVFTLAKTLRDAFEAKLLQARWADRDAFDDRDDR